ALWHLRVRLLGDTMGRTILRAEANTFDEGWLMLWIDQTASRRGLRLLATSPYRWHRELCAWKAPTDVVMRDRTIRRRPLAEASLRNYLLVRRTSGKGSRMRFGSIEQDVAMLVRKAPSLTHEELRRLGDMMRRAE